MLLQVIDSANKFMHCNILLLLYYFNKFAMYKCLLNFERRFILLAHLNALKCQCTKTSTTAIITLKVLYVYDLKQQTDFYYAWRIL